MGSEGRGPEASVKRAPTCPLGYIDDDINEIFPVLEEKARFYRWMDGQTVAICAGERYDYDNRTMVPDECVDNPHGYIYYTWDVKAFLDGRPPLD
jgi:hypothetical protein